MTDETMRKKFACIIDSTSFRNSKTFRKAEESKIDLRCMTLKYIIFNF